MRSFITRKMHKNTFKDQLFRRNLQNYKLFGDAISIKKILTSYANYLTICVAFCFVILVDAQNSLAKNADKDSFLQHYEKDLKQIESYLNNIKNLSANFIQETSDGGVAHGKLLLSRPGKMRIEYEGQQKILIIVNGSVLSYTDVELEETSYLSTNTTPASFLTRSNISFSAKDVEITGIKKSDNQIKISVIKKNRTEAGEFSIIFTINPLKFIKMEVKNDLDQITNITLRDADFSSPISSNIFVIKNKNLPN